MTNREYIMHTNLYDFLMMVSNNLDSNNMEGKGSNCIIQLICGENQFHRCCMNWNEDDECASCVQKWLNEPYERGW